MPQSAILENLLKFASLEEKEFSQKLESDLKDSKEGTPEHTKLKKQFEKHQKEYKEHSEKLKKITKGLCFGLSVCHGLMDEIGKLQWWEAALRLAADWKDESLDEIIVLPDTNLSDPSIIDENTLPGVMMLSEKPHINLPSRRNIFNRILNYAYSAHASGDLSSFMLANTTQNTILKPITDREKKELKQVPLECLDNKSVKKTIQKNLVVSGYFSNDQLKKILEKNLKDKIIAVVQSKKTRHAIRIGKKEGKYFTYDPNYSHKSNKTGAPIYREFSNIEGMIAELNHIQENAMGIEFSSVDPNEQFDDTHYQEIIDKCPESLISESGLTHIAKFNPTLCAQLILQAGSKFTLKKMIISELKDETQFGNCVVAMAQSAPVALKFLISLAAEKGETRVRFALGDALSCLDSENFPALSYIADHRHELIVPLFKLGEGDEKFCNLLASALKLQMSEKFKEDHRILDYPESAFLQLLKLAATKQGAAIYKLLAAVITRKTSNGVSGLQLLARNSSSEKFKRLMLMTCEAADGSFRQEMMKVLPDLFDSNQAEKEGCKKIIAMLLQSAVKFKDAGLLTQLFKWSETTPLVSEAIFETSNLQKLISSMEILRFFLSNISKVKATILLEKLGSGFVNGLAKDSADLIFVTSQLQTAAQLKMFGVIKNIAKINSTPTPVSDSSPSIELKYK